MALDADAVIDRRMLRRRVTFWRAMTVLAILAALAVVGFAVASRAGLLATGQHVARIEVRGFIAQDRDFQRMLDQIGRNANVRGVVVTIDSPGGTVAGAEGLFVGIRALAERKPTVAVVDGVAASGGYIAAIATDHIVARETSITGSIGVVAQFPNVSRLLTNLGVSVDAVRSTPLKAQPSGVEPTSPEALAALNQMVSDSYGWFQRIVQERRGLNADELRQAADGRVFAGARAHGMKLVDTIGGEREARQWLAGRDVAATLPIRTYRPTRDGQLPFLPRVAAALVEAMGLDGVADRLRASGLVARIESATLDGVLAVWQPSTP